MRLRYELKRIRKNEKMRKLYLEINKIEKE